MMKATKLNKRILKFFGIIFVSIGVWHLASLALLNYEFADEEIGIAGYNYRIDKPLDGWEDPRLQRVVGESDLEFSTRLTSVVFNSIYHCSPYESAKSPVSSWVLKIMNANWGEQGILALQYIRCGFCHQTAYILAKALNKGGLTAIPWGINGHVVTKVEINGQEFLFDPDYNVSLIDYTNYNFDEIKLNYKLNSRWNDAAAASFSSKDDDGPYYNLKRLFDIEKEQEILISTVYDVIFAFVQTITLVLCIALALISIIVIIVIKLSNYSKYRF